MKLDEFGFCFALSLALLVQPVMTDARRQEPDQPVTVTVGQPRSDVRVFNPARLPDPPPPILPGLQAATPYGFECHQQCWFDNVDEFTDNSGTVHVQERPTWFKVTTGLHILTWLPNDASEKLKEHEEGHVEMYKTIYAQRAQKAAIDAASPLVGRVFEGSGPDAESARSQIQHKVTKALCGRFHELTRDLALQADLQYDSVTDHGRNRVHTNAAVRATLDSVLLNQPTSQSNETTSQPYEPAPQRIERGQ